MLARHEPELRRWDRGQQRAQRIERRVLAEPAQRDLARAVRTERDLPAIGQVRTTVLLYECEPRHTELVAARVPRGKLFALAVVQRQAIELLVQVKGMTREDAYQLISVSCDVDVTQLVDGPYGVHVMIPKAIFAAKSGSR